MGKNRNKILTSSSCTEGALQELGGRISSADFSSADSFFGHDAVTASKYLHIFANFKHLSVRIEFKPSALDMLFLFLKISRLPKLASLELDNADFSAMDNLSARPCSNLTHLTLSGMPSLQLEELADILKVHPVTSLCLRDVIDVENLSIAGKTDDALLGLFDAAPLKHIELCAYRGGKNSARITPLQITAFIIKHRTSLLTFKADRLFFDAAEVSAMNRSLEQEGVFVRVVTVE